MKNVIKDVSQFLEDFYPDIYRNVKNHTLTEKEEKILDLFNFLKREYPEIFEGVEIFFTNGFWYRNCICGSYTDIEHSYIFMSEIAFNELCNYCPIWKQLIQNKLKKINSNLNLFEFTLLHELGHYLDKLDNIELYYENSYQTPFTKRNILEKFPELTDDEFQMIYIKTRNERKANINAFKMAEVLNRNNGA